MNAPKGPGVRDGRRHMGRWALLAALVVSVGLLLLRGTGSPGPDPREETPLVEASTTTAVSEDLPVTVEALGLVTPEPGSLARPSAPAPTRVVRVLVSEGDRVERGQALVALDASVFEARAREAEAYLASAQRAHERQERLVEQGIAPRKELEAATAELARARSAATEARRSRDLATVRAPIAGVVTAVLVALGEPVEGNQPVVEIVDPHGLAVLFTLAPEDAARVEAGQEVVIAGAGSGRPAPGGDGIWARGTVTGVSAVVGSGSGGVTVRARVAAVGRPLLSGEMVAGWIVVGTHPRAVTVPLSALVGGEDGVHVFVVDGDGVAHRTPVVVGERTATSAEILQGLADGARVVTEGAYGVTDGARVGSGAP